jgi:carbamoyltransferase
MIILGINNSHLSTAALLVNGKLVACISEERLSRIKNQSGLPVKAVKEVLRIAKIKPKQVDYIVFGFKDPQINTGYSVYPTTLPTTGFSLTQFIWQLKEALLAAVPVSRYIYQSLIGPYYQLFMNRQLDLQLSLDVQKKLGIGSDKIIKCDHHTAHAAAAFYSSADHSNGKKLIFTLDAMGDGLCASVSQSENGVMTRIAATKAGNSLGDLYAYVTSYLGLKRGEHEFKVMGLAPYASEKHFIPLYKKLRKMIWVNDDLTFSTSVYSHVFYKKLDKLFLHQRFDNVAGAVQKVTEDLLKEWISKSIKQTGIKDIICGGGVFMNVKANQLILEMPMVQSMFIVPSCGDESTAFGAAFWAYQKYANSAKYPIQPLRELYLGSVFTDREIQSELKKNKYRALKINRYTDIEKEVAKILSEGGIVARFKGRAEWGARSLGNRSILANPSHFGVIKEINDQIKSRDFWMPFAPSIKSENLEIYVTNPKKMKVPYMIITLNSTSKGQQELIAAMHPYDGTLRPQEVYQDWNPDYWHLINEFEKLTGIGGVLNTSFNLHGFPIVQTPEDALDVLLRSGLKHLAIGSFLVSKK